MRGDVVNLVEEKDLPDDFVGHSKYSEKYIGRLLNPDGTFYSKYERNLYYDQKAEKKHIAKTPLHIARFAVQQYTSPGDLVLDPTMGAGTTAVEAVTQGRNVIGVELQFIDVIRANLKKNSDSIEKFKVFANVVPGDARNIRELLLNGLKEEVDLVVNNPPYSGDENQSKNIDDKDAVSIFNKYNHDLKENLAFLKEGSEYVETFDAIYKACIESLKIGGRFVVGVKDMMRNKKVFKLHEMLGDILSKYLEYEGMVLLKHHPPTLFQSTYSKMKSTLGIKVPAYQTILIFKKEKK
jgi:DNA modification methylase